MKTTVNANIKTTQEYKTVSRCMACKHRFGIVAKAYEVYESKIDGHKVSWVEKVTACIGKHDLSKCKFHTTDEDFEAEESSYYHGNRQVFNKPCNNFNCDFVDKSWRPLESDMEGIVYKIIECKESSLTDGELVELLNKSSMNQIETLSLYYENPDDKSTLTGKYITPGYDINHNRGWTAKNTVSVILDTLCTMFGKLSDRDKYKVAVLLTLNTGQYTFGSKLLWYLTNHHVYRNIIVGQAKDDMISVGETSTQRAHGIYNDEIEASDTSDYVAVDVDAINEEYDDYMGECVVDDSKSSVESYEYED